MTLSLFVSVDVSHTHYTLASFSILGSLFPLARHVALKKKDCVIVITLHVYSMQGELRSLGLHGLPSVT